MAKRTGTKLAAATAPAVAAMLLSTRRRDSLLFTIVIESSCCRFCLSGAALAQLEALNLSRRGLGQLADEVDPARIFERREPCLDAVSYTHLRAHETGR